MSEMSYKGSPYEEGIDLLKAENERLRAALKELDTATHVYIASSPIDSVKVNFVMDKALLASKKALQTEEGKSNGE